MAERRRDSLSKKSSILLPQINRHRTDKSLTSVGSVRQRSSTTLGFRISGSRELPDLLDCEAPNGSQDFFSDWKDALERGRERFDSRKKGANPGSLSMLNVQRQGVNTPDLDTPKYFLSDARIRLREPSMCPLVIEAGSPDSDAVGTNREKSSRGSIRQGTVPRSLSVFSSSSFSARQLKTSGGRNVPSTAGSKYFNTLKAEIFSVDPISGEVTVEVDGSTIGKIDCADAERPTMIYSTITGLKNIHHLRIARFRVGTGGAEILASALVRYANLLSLSLTETALYSAGATAISRGLSQISGLASLCLDSNGVGAKGLHAIVEAVPCCSSLTHLSVANNALADEGAAVLARGLLADTLSAVPEGRPGCARHLVLLTLRNNNIGPAGCVELCGALAEFCAAQMLYFDLSDNPLTACGNDFAPAAALGSALKAMSALHSLNLSNTELYTEGGRLVVDGLTHRERDMRQQILATVRRAGEEKRNLDGELARLEAELKQYQTQRPLQNLNLDRNLISVENLNALGEYRCLFNGLRVLGLASSDLTGNRYNATFDGIAGFANGLKSARFLEVLGLADNRMSSEDGEQSCFPLICEALLQLPNLRHLDLSRNNLGVKDIQRLASVLGRLGKLLILNLRANRLGSDGLKSLAPALKRSLTDLDLAENNIGPDGITALAMRLSDVTNLTRLDLSHNHFSAVLGDYIEHHSEHTLFSGEGALAAVGAVARAATRGNKGKYSAIFRTVAKKMSEAGSEVRKAALFGNALLRSDAIQRGFPLFARRCAEHLASIRVIILGLSLEAGLIRGGVPNSVPGNEEEEEEEEIPPGSASSRGSPPPTATAVSLDFSSRRFGKEDTILFFELLKLNTALTSLSFSGNDLTDNDEADSVRAGCVADWLTHAHRLTRLDLTNSRLHAAGAHLLAGGLRHATSLRELRMQGCGIMRRGFHAVTGSLAALSCLTHLDLSNNMLTAEPHHAVSGSHPPEVLEEEHDIDGQAIHGGFSMEPLKSCVALEVLDLRKCGLRDEGAMVAAAVLRHLTNLLHLFVAENEIGVEGQEEIATALHSCTRIQSTDNIKAPDPGQREWSLRGQIEFAYQVSFVASCMKRHALTTLDVSLNSLGRFPASFLAFAATLALVPTITELDICDNGPCSERVCQTLARSLRSLSDLQVLKISNNSISGEGAAALMCNIITLKELRLLDVQHNLFHFAPCALPEFCSNLQRLDLLYNPWLSPTQRVMEKKTYREIREGMLSLYGEGKLNNELVLAFVGSEEVGKSALIAALVNSPNLSRTSQSLSRPLSRALDVLSWHPRGEGGPLFTVYDFAGLSLYRSVQELFFFPRRALYCLVWRPFSVVTDFEYSDQNQALDLLQNEGPFYRVRGHGLVTQNLLEQFLDQQVRSWISSLFKRVPGCNVMLVATHMDKTSNESLQWQCNLMKSVVAKIVNDLLAQSQNRTRAPRFFFGGDSMTVSSQSGTGIFELRDALISAAVQLPFYAELLPKSWYKAMQALRTEASKATVVPVKIEKRKKASKQEVSQASFHHLVRLI